MGFDCISLLVHVTYTRDKVLLAGQPSSLVYLSFMVSKYSKNPSRTVIVLQSQFPITHKKSLIENYTRATMAKYKSLERVWTTQDLTLEWLLFFRQASCILDSPLHDKEESIKVSSLKMWVGDKGLDIFEGFQLAKPEVEMYM